MKLGLLNASIVTEDGTYSVRTVTTEEARKIAQNAEGIDSAVGHLSTAQILSALLGVEVKFNETRKQFAQEVGQSALALQLKSRAPEGQVLSIHEIERIGYDIKHIVRIS
jgi:STIV B116-like